MGFITGALGAARSLIDYLDDTVAPSAKAEPKDSGGHPPSTPNTAETPLWSQFSRIGGNLSPQGVSQIILEADGGAPARLVDLLHECRQKDGTMQEVMSLRELSVASLDWSIELPDDAKRKDKKAAEALTDALKESSTLPLLFAHAIGEGNALGYAWSEVLWDYRGGYLVPKKFEPIHSRRFGYRQADGKLLYLPKPGSSPDHDGVDLFEEYAPGNFVGHFPRINGDAMVREGYGRMLVWMGLFRNWDIRDWIQLGELGWKPWRIGTYLKGADAKDKNILQQAIKTLAATGAALLPETAKFTIEWPKGTASSMQGTHAELAAFLGQEMAKGVLGGTLSSDSGVKGARSLGEVHDRMRLINRDFDARGVDAFMTEQICKPFAQYNGNTIHGRFRCNVRETADLEKLAKAVSLLAGKIDIPQEWVREQGGIRKPKPGEQLVVVTHPAKPEPPSSSGTDNGSDSDSDANGDGSKDTVADAA